MALNKTKESWHNQIFIFFLMVELVLFFLNGDQYFQLSGWYLPLLGALLFGIPSLLKNKYTFLRMLPIILLLVFILGCIVNFLHLVAINVLLSGLCVCVCVFIEREQTVTGF